MKLAEQIDAVLPQTQCGLCGFAGCMPYAEALANEEVEINLCPPGGVTGLKSLAHLLSKDPSPYIAEMETKAKQPLKAIIREAECIGCTKCIQACPVDAILGASKLMHSVITDECTGCELCVTPCPVDCIDMIPVTESITPMKSNHFRQRFYAREERLKTSHIKERNQHQTQIAIDKKSYIQMALDRVKKKQHPSS